MDEKKVEYQRRYYSANREKFKERHRKYYLLHREDQKEKGRAYRESHRDYKNAAAREWYKKNREYALAQRANYRARNPGQKREYDLMTKFKITKEEYSKILLSQGGGCAICNRPEGSGKSLAVDHDHETGKVRGILCGNCNVALGLIGDSISIALVIVYYLKKYKQGEKP